MTSPPSEQANTHQSYSPAGSNALGCSALPTQAKLFDLSPQYLKHTTATFWTSIYVGYVLRYMMLHGIGRVFVTSHSERGLTKLPVQSQACLVHCTIRVVTNVKADDWLCGKEMA